MTNEFNFDVKHEDYEEWLNQIERKRQVFLRIFKSSDFPYNCN